MKYRYIVVSCGGEMLWGLSEISKERLGRVLTKLDDQIIDTQNGTYYDKEHNCWEEIKGDN